MLQFARAFRSESGPTDGKARTPLQGSSLRTPQGVSLRPLCGVVRGSQPGTGTHFGSGPRPRDSGAPRTSFHAATEGLGVVFPGKLPLGFHT